MAGFYHAAVGHSTNLQGLLEFVFCTHGNFSELNTIGLDLPHFLDFSYLIRFLP
jgi:hypothetical protein